MYKDNIVQDFSEEAWLAFHQGEINDADDFYNFKHSWIDNKVIYTYEGRKICDELNYDVFQEHDLFGKAEDYSQAGFCALYDLLNDDEGDTDFTGWYSVFDSKSGDTYACTIEGFNENGLVWDCELD